jgi:cytochrome c2
LALVGLFLKDYDRPWKKYQKEFRGMEIEKTRIKYDADTTKLEKNPEYQQLKTDLEEAQKVYQTNCAKVTYTQEEIKGLQAKDDILNQQYKFKKTELDVAKFKYEESMGHGHADATLKETYLKLDQETLALKRSLEESAEFIKAKKDVIGNCQSQIKEIERKQRGLTAQSEILKRKLKKIDPNEMSFINQIANLIRDLPVLDLSNPNYKVEQIVLNDITDDVILKQVPKVDRCITCHLGIANPDYKNAPQPLKTHPNLELYIGKDSAHPMEEFGCTVCHGGRGRGTDFITSVHTPSSPDQAKEWIKKYAWHEMHHWEEPMLPLEHTQASCFKCHSGESAIKGAEKLNLGLNLIERAGCYNCHTIEKYQDWPKSGPDLTQIASKLPKRFAYRWIEAPHEFRHNTWMPDFFNLSNNSDEASRKRSQQEIHTIVHYLYANSKPYNLTPLPVEGNAQKGEELVKSVGCLACHQIKPDKEDRPLSREQLMKEHGPNLIGLGSKTSKEWLYAWLKNPQSYHAQTRMPNLRLSDQEAADITEFLYADENQKFNNKSTPEIDPVILDQIALDFLKKVEHEKSAQSKISQMTTDEKLLLAGEKLIGHYGCYACHDIKGFENAKPIGADLTEVGNKPVNKFDFGFIHIEHSKEAWFKQKLLDPRIYDQDKIKEPNDKLIMPNFRFSQEEASAITTALLGFVKNNTVTNKIKPRTPENLMIEEGQKIVRQFNCQGCHIMENEGGAIKESVKNWLVQYDGREEAEAQAIVASFSPPNLIGQGQKTQTDWLFEFLHKPTPIRPWLKTRMPTYGFNAAHLNALVKYFNALDHEPFPYTDEENLSLSDEEFTAAEKLFSNEYFGCAQCHIVGDKMPSGSADSWAPNFALTKSRLKPGWVSKWLKNPQDLLPGTKMPTYFDPNSFSESGPPDILNGDEYEQIRVLRNYLTTLADHTPVQTPALKTAVKEEPAPAAVQPEETPASTPDFWE